MDLSAAVTVMEAMRWTPMTRLKCRIWSFSFRQPAPTYKDISQFSRCWSVSSWSARGHRRLDHQRLAAEPRRPQIGSVEQLSASSTSSLNTSPKLDELESKTSPAWPKWAAGATCQACGAGSD